MPKEDEVYAALDALFLSKWVSWEFELRQWREAARISELSPFAKLRGQRPERMPAGWAKRQFNQQLYELVALALDQAEKVRKGKKATDVYLMSAQVVEVQRDQWAVELYLGSAGHHLKEGFRNDYEARRWAIYESEEYLISKGLKKGTKLTIIGDEYS